MAAKAEGLIQRFQNPTATIPYNFEPTREIWISKNREILKWVIRTFILCGKQCISLRGYREDIHNSSNNCGNFRAILKPLSETNSDLKHHLELDAPSLLNYVSFVSMCLTCLCALRAYVPSCVKLLRAYVPACLKLLRALIFHVPTCLRAFIYIFSCLRAFVPQIISRLRALIFNVLTCLQPLTKYI